MLATRLKMRKLRDKLVKHGRKTPRAREDLFALLEPVLRYQNTASLTRLYVFFLSNRLTTEEKVSIREAEKAFERRWLRSPKFAPDFKKVRSAFRGVTITLGSTKKSERDIAAIISGSDVIKSSVAMGVRMHK